MLPLSKRQRRVIPPEYRRNFLHLYLDVAWFGVLNGTSIAFVAIFATRQGATGFEVGLLNAAPAIVALIIALPAGRRLTGRPLGPIVFWAAVWHRLFYLPWILLPWLLTPPQQVHSLIGLAFIMSAPGTILAIGFNGLFAAAVPEAWRGYVVGRRNAILAFMSILVSLLCGVVLKRLPFITGYQVVFGLGCLGAALSTLHLWFVRPAPEEQASTTLNQAAINDWEQPGAWRLWADSRSGVGLRFLTYARRWKRFIPLEAVRGRFGLVVVLLFGFHASQFLAIPLFPLYVVNVLHLSDQFFSLGNGVFYAALFIGSTQLARLTGHWGNQRALALGVICMSLYPLFLGLSHGPQLYLFTSIIGGIAWSIAGGALGNYVLDQAPAANRPAYLAWHTLALYAAMLLGSLAGPWLAHQVGLTTALFVAAGCRFLAGVALWRWG